jgi:excisionase family DNA binding protein
MPESILKADSGSPEVDADNLKFLFSDARSRLLSAEELGVFLGKSRRTVQRMARAKKIPTYIVNRSFRFRLGEVEEALQRYRIREVSL